MMQRQISFQPRVVPKAMLALDEQLIAAIEAKNIPVIELDVDENGNIFVDPDKAPDLYNWAVNG
ncbi:MAG: hypothetical protein FWG87_11665 [Defluviitaleaceae bacterium]|nr:hypothetical protein [Defluviitaleaceae bacterium]